MDLIVLIGSGAVGKMTVGQELMKITDFRLFHNHMMIEPVIDIFGKFNGSVVNKLRETIMDEFIKTKYQGMIFTFMWAFDMKEDWDYIASVASKFEETGGTVYYVELVADQAVRLERNKTENRLRNKASKRDLAISEDRIIREETKYRIVSNEGEIPFANYMKIDNTNLSPDVVARMIKDNFNLPDVSTTELENKVMLEEVRDDEVEQLYELQVDSFMPLYEKYHDEGSPAIEVIDRVRWKVNDKNRTFYFIVKDGARVGGVCVSYGRVKNEEVEIAERDIVTDDGFVIDKNVVYISPIFIRPKYQNLHIGQIVINKLFDMYKDSKIWKLWTIREEEGNCHFYEKCGFTKTGEEQKIKDDMHLVEYEKVFE